MEILYEKDGIVIINGDCREVLKEFDPHFFDACITDPPYGLEFMGKGWDKGVPGADFWKEVLRVLKPGAHALAFGGTRTFHRLTCAIEDSGFEIRDCLSWLYGGGFPKSMDISKAIDKAAGAERQFIAPSPFKASEEAERRTEGKCQSGRTTHPDITAPATDLAKLWSGYGTALKPAWEPIILGMKPTDGTFVENAEKWGVAGLNIEGCRIGTEKRFNPPAGNKPGTNSLNMSVYGMPADAQEPWASGRFPANLILDEDAGKLLDGQTGQLQSGALRPYKENHHNASSYKLERDKNYTSEANSGGASRFFYCPKASKSDRGDGNNHPTVKPLELMKYLCKLASTPTGGLILDPFMGSGTTLVAAKALGRPAIGIELSKEYCDIAIKRLEL